MQLSGNKILITGATDGIGKALMLEFLKHNNEIIAVGRDINKLLTTSLLDKRIITFACDISIPEELQNLANFVIKNHSDTNIIINNAGVQFNYNFFEQTENILYKINTEISINFIAPVQLISLLYPVLSANKNAAIVNISSGLGIVPKSNAAVYCATKAAIHIFTKSLRYQTNKIKVFEAIPPLVDTSMTEGRGKGKISTQDFVNEFIMYFKKDVLEMNIGKVKLLRFINRISPALADKLMKNGR